MLDAVTACRSVAGLCGATPPDNRMALYKYTNIGIKMVVPASLDDNRFRASPWSKEKAAGCYSGYFSSPQSPKRAQAGR